MKPIPQNAKAVTTSASQDLPKPGCIYVGTAGNVKATAVGDADDTYVTFKNVPAGMIIPVMIKRVHTDSTAADMVVLTDM